MRREKHRITRPLLDHVLLEEVVRGLVARPERVRVDSTQVHATTNHLVIHVAPDDRGKVIGKQGKTIDSIRAIFMAIASLRGHRIFIEVDEPDRGVVPRGYGPA